MMMMIKSLIPEFIPRLSLSLISHKSAINSCQYIQDGTKKLSVYRIINNRTIQDSKCCSLTAPGADQFRSGDQSNLSHGFDSTI